MSGPFISLGLKATNKLIDDHFDKIPDHIFHPHTYSRKKANRQKAKERVRQRKESAAAGGAGAGAGAAAADKDNRDDGSGSDGYESDSDHEHPDIPKHSGHVPGQPESLASPISPISPIYSHDSPRLRDKYVPAAYQTPPSTAGSWSTPPPPRTQYDFPPPSRSQTQYATPPGSSHVPRNMHMFQESPLYSEPRRASTQLTRNQSPPRETQRFEYPPIPKSQYAPPPPPIGSYEPPQARRNSTAHAPPPTSTYTPPTQRGRSLYDDDYEYQSQRPRRPKIVTRRSSSYHHGPRTRHSSSNDYGYITANDRIQQAREVKAERKDNRNILTGSPTGLAGGAAGAILGGLAAKAAQKDGGKGKEDPILTMLGAAVGGLAVNAATNKWEEDKEHEERVMHGRSRDGSRSTYSRSHRDSRGYGSDEGVSRTESGRRRRRHRRSFGASGAGYGSDD